MKSLLLTIVLLSFLIIAATNNDNNKVLTSNNNNEDYGCLHEEHSQYDDGDSLNLDIVNYSNNN